MAFLLVTSFVPLIQSPCAWGSHGRWKQERRPFLLLPRPHWKSEEPTPINTEPHMFPPALIFQWVWNVEPGCLCHQKKCHHSPGMRQNTACWAVASEHPCSKGQLARNMWEVRRDLNATTLTRSFQWSMITLNSKGSRRNRFLPAPWSAPRPAAMRKVGANKVVKRTLCPPEGGPSGKPRGHLCLVEKGFSGLGALQMLPRPWNSAPPDRIRCSWFLGHLSLTWEAPDPSLSIQ